jgi:hypothetical protein
VFKSPEQLAEGAASPVDVVDDLDQLVPAVTAPAGELDELLRSLDDGSALGRRRDGDAASAPELEQRGELNPPSAPSSPSGLVSSDPISEGWSTDVPGRQLAPCVKQRVTLHTIVVRG